MRQCLLLFVLLVSGAGLLAAEPINGVVRPAEQERRLFLFVGEPNAKAWRILIDTAQDRQATAAAAVAKLGGEILSYYFGLGDGKNYIIASLPDDETLIQALYVTRLGDDLLKSYEMTELLTSPQMAKALARVKEVKAVDDID